MGLGVRGAASVKPASSTDPQMGSSLVPDGDWKS